MPPKKLAVLLLRILKQLREDGARFPWMCFMFSQSAQPFTEDEEVQIREMLGLTRGELDTMVNAASYIFEQAAYRDIAADQLRSSLVESGVAEAQVLFRSIFFIFSFLG